MCVQTQLIAACVGLEFAAEECPDDVSDNEDPSPGQMRTDFSAPIVLPLLSTTLPGTAGFFSSEWLVSYSIATVITAIALLIGAVTHVSDVAQPTQVAGPSRSIESSNPQSLIPNPSPSPATGVRRPDHRHGRLPMGQFARCPRG